MYRLEFTEQAYTDMRNLSDTIMYTYKMPLTAEKYMRGLREVINDLKRSPESYTIQTRRSLLQYGTNVRRINYKRMAIIYTTHADLVYIHRIVPASMITGL
ncbi:hypothetical protein D0T49_00555 [Paludibacter sp. 221]|uniref:type II toxin-antitoxin system RelE/ParE family toxin n=1 Tax=Paludibacter sp. 221 TaxID=2302939 RepID=UPI0013D00949|nr:type II toxin-antitoxin system RelE/ParE family toxin [Paludibacter sp. 221]NDV45543.1 hypothetical protein [Paludibacter sp. 221]